MKKILSILLCALLAMLPAVAEAPDGAPDMGGDLYSGEQVPRDGGSEEGALVVEVNGETVKLLFDDSPLYSSVQNGLVQASYSAYGSDGDTLYVLYMLFPDTAMAGMVITPEYAVTAGEEASVVLIISSREREQYYYSSALAGTIYPAGSTFSIALDSVDPASGGTAYAGRLSATLIMMEPSGEREAGRLTIPETAFSFTIGGYAGPSAAPGATPVPEDMRKV